jgi:hypothetical protein
MVLLSFQTSLKALVIYLVSNCPLLILNPVPTSSCLNQLDPLFEEDFSGFIQKFLTIGFGITESKLTHRGNYSCLLILFRHLVPTIILFRESMPQLKAELKRLKSRPLVMSLITALATALFPMKNIMQKQNHLKSLGNSLIQIEVHNV